jgi:hypothetical protein
MNLPAETPGFPPTGVHQPCTEACAAFRPLASDRWSEFGMCLNPRSPRRGYPVRVGRECNDFQVTGKVDPTRAS